MPYANATGPHGSDFAVGSQAAKSDQNSNQNASRNGDGQRYRHREEKNFRNAWQRSAIASYQVQQSPQIASEQHEVFFFQAEDGIRDDFLENVAGQNAHRSSAPTTPE